MPVPNQRETMIQRRRDARNGGRDDFLDRGLPVVDRDYHSVTAMPRGNPATDTAEHDRSLSRLERVVGK
jgi:hypothetical protein